MVAVDLLELAVSPGLELILAAGGLAAFTGWTGPILALTRIDSRRSTVAEGATGWRARRGPTLVHEQGDGLTLRSSIDGSTHRLTTSGLARAAVDLGATPAEDIVARLAWWDSPEETLPSANFVVSAVPAAAARDGRYWTSAGWAEVAAEADSAAAGSLVPGCRCRTCEIAEVGYIAHLWRQREITAAHLLGWHNQHQVRLLLEG